jgi:hypothetical protein
VSDEIELRSHRSRHPSAAAEGHPGRRTSVHHEQRPERSMTMRELFDVIERESAGYGPRQMLRLLAHVRALADELPADDTDPWSVALRRDDVEVIFGDHPDFTDAGAKAITLRTPGPRWQTWLGNTDDDEDLTDSLAHEIGHVELDLFSTTDMGDPEIERRVDEYAAERFDRPGLRSVTCNP